MPSTVHRSKQSLFSICSTLVTGLSALPDPSLLLGGGSIAKTSALAPLQAYVSAEQEVSQAEAIYRAAVAKAHAAEVPARAMVADLTPYLRTRLGKTNPALETQFGIAPLKPRATPVAHKAAGAVKAVATRKAKKAAVANVGKTPEAPQAAPAGNAPAPATTVKTTA